ncbi:MAG TPA: penicillin-binding protein 2 [Acidimicrobiales bacterium]
MSGRVTQNRTTPARTPPTRRYVAPSRPSNGGSRRRARGWRDAGDPRRRAITLLGLLAALFGVVGARLVWVQVIGADRYVAYGDDQRLNTIHLVADRGSIFDRNHYDLAVTLPQQTVVADPRLITNPQATAATLATLLAPLGTTDEAKIYKQLTRKSAFAYIARRIPDDIASQIEAQNIEGIRFVDEAKRINPSGDLGRSVLGQVGVDNEGLSALELQYDEALSGRPGELVLETDPEGRTIPAGRHDLTPATPGDDLILTLDRNLQYQAEQIMRDAIGSTQSLGGTAVVSNPETGEIYAMVNMEVDPNTGEPVISGNNLAVTLSYEPGSVLKVITLGAAVQEGLVAPDTTLRVPDRLQVADHEFTDDHEHLTMNYTVTDILRKSSNIGTILVAQDLGKQKLYDYLRAFGFGDRTALEFPGEAAGAYPKPSDWSGTSIGTIPIGQGIAVTPMQMLYAYNAIANDGVYVPPRLVGEVVDEDGNRTPTSSGEPRRVVSQTTASQMREMMVHVVDDGTGEAAGVEGYQVAGKTGTARKPAPNGNGYLWDDDRYHYISTFAGFMPANDPKLSIIVVLDEPADTYASSTAAPAFKELARHALRTLRLAPPVTDPQTGVPLFGADSPLIRSDPAAAPEPPPDAAPASDQNGAPLPAGTEVPGTTITPTTAAEAPLFPAPVPAPLPTPVEQLIAVGGQRQQ